MSGIASLVLVFLAGIASLVLVFLAGIASLVWCSWLEELFVCIWRPCYADGTAQLVL